MKQDDKHLAAVREESCLVCQHPGTVAHHVRTPFNAGVGTKPSSVYTVPLCNLHHHELHYVGECNFWENHNINPFEWIVRFLIKVKKI